MSRGGGAEPAVLARSLTKRYGGFTAVDGIDFTVPRGVCFGFLGPNGAGKTSTMRMVYALSPRTAGELRVLGRDVGAAPREVKARLGVVPQESNLDNELTVRENLIVYARFFGVRRREAAGVADEALEFVELSNKAHARVDALSGGMKRRLLIARALVNDPDLLVLDEPTTGLDPQARTLLWEKVRELRNRGKTILLTTHYMDEAEKLCDDLVIMDGGHIIARGAPGDLVRQHIGREVLEVTADAAAQERILHGLDGGVTGHDAYGQRLLVYGKDAEELYAQVRGMGVEAREVMFRRANLEDVFLRLTGRQLSE